MSCNGEWPHCLTAQTVTHSDYYRNRVQSGDVTLTHSGGPRCYCHTGKYCIMSAAVETAGAVRGQVGSGGGAGLLCNMDTMKESGAIGRDDSPLMESRSLRTVTRPVAVNSRHDCHTFSSRCSDVTSHFHHV